MVVSSSHIFRNSWWSSGYFLLEDVDKKFAKKLIIIGAVMTGVWILLSILLVSISFLLGLFKASI
jgi:hypothetical protein